MQKPFAPASNEVVELLKEALSQGHTVILPAPDRLAGTATSVDRALTAPPLRSNAESSLVATCSLLLKLTHAESRAFVQLVKHDHVTREELHAAIARDGDPVTVTKIVDVVISRLRRKLAEHGLAIDTIRGQGFRLAERARDRLRKILAEYGEDIISAAAPPVSQADSRGATTKPPRPRAKAQSDANAA